MVSGRMVNVSVSHVMERQNNLTPFDLLTDSIKESCKCGWHPPIPISMDSGYAFAGALAPSSFIRF